MMKTLQECKDQVAKKYGYSNWQAFVRNEIHKHATTIFWDFIDEAAELYASQYKELNAELLSGIKKYCFHWDSYFSNKIVGNPPIIQDLKELITKAEQSNLF